MRDVYGREIKIDEEGLSFLFDHDRGLDPSNYKDSRGKRLPWIRPTLKNSKAIYEVTEQAWTTYFYTSVHSVPYKDKKIKNYFMIVVRKTSGKPLRLVTAYHFDKEHMFLKYLEPAHPFCLYPQG